MNEGTKKKPAQFLLSTKSVENELSLNELFLKLSMLEDRTNVTLCQRAIDSAQNHSLAMAPGGYFLEGYGGSLRGLSKREFTRRNFSAVLSIAFLTCACVFSGRHWGRSRFRAR